jgi:hypothetical protein
MPEISRFYGILIGMFYDEHRPPHFHVRYAQYQAVIRIYDLRLAEGHLPRRALALVTEWTANHRTELLQNWEAIETRRPLRKIEPLD